MLVDAIGSEEGSLASLSISKIDHDMNGRSALLPAVLGEEQHKETNLAERKHAHARDVLIF